ncbi:DUF2141 domain-containing protein [Aequorivita capsosiphonis]|uniref:DUF2141 domain-containing protein n=1 Tax=Aequorivita capsosiphonis TaxID=487317 RepID=UPI00047CE0E1|nr:DUF2141 domain-containing protein [Aequorivita capsosiphonis]
MNYLIIFFTLLFINTQSNDTHTLTVTIDNIKTMEGTLEVALFNKSDRFMEEGQAYKSVSIKVENGSETFVFENLPKDVYAISLYHDENANGECDRNFFGIPKEPYAFSNNFKPKFSAPTFDDCQFELTADTSMEIELLKF